MTRGPQNHPKGEKITPTEEGRVEVKRLRLAAGLTQEELAPLVPCSPATISNLEKGGRHPQVFKTVYAQILRVLKAPGKMNDNASEERFRRIVGKLIVSNERTAAAVEAARFSERLGFPVGGGDSVGSHGMPQNATGRTGLADA